MTAGIYIYISSGISINIHIHIYIYIKHASPEDRPGISSKQLDVGTPGCTVAFSNRPVFPRQGMAEEGAQVLKAWQRKRHCEDHWEMTGLTGRGKPGVLGMGR